MERLNFCGWYIYCFQMAANVKAERTIFCQRICKIVYWLAFRYGKVGGLKHGLVVLDVSGGKNSLPYHPAKRFDERLVVLLRIYIWQYSDDCMIRSAKWGTSTCGEQRRMVYINVIKVSLIPGRELNDVVNVCQVSQNFLTFRKGEH